jgi:hypothetical protein
MRVARRVAAPLGALLALAAAAALAGCGGSDEPEEPPGVPSAPKEFYGVMPQSELADADFERMAEGDVGTLRLFLPWAAVDPTAKPGDFDFSFFEPLMAGAARAGVEPLVYIAGMPEWAMARDGCESDCGTLAPRSPETIEAWREFAAAAAERFGPDGDFWRENPDLPERPVRQWQIWNEENSPTFYAPKPDVEGFARLLIAAEEEIRKRDESATVLLGGMFGTPFKGKPPALTAVEFLRQLYAIDGIERRFDGVAVHPYAAQLDKVDSQLQTLRDEIDRAGDDASLWVTEIGWSSGEGPNPLDRGLEGQAERLTEAFTLFAERRQEWDLKTVVWFSWRDLAGQTICDWCPGSGLFAEGGLEPKPAWEAFTSFSGGS